MELTIKIVVENFGSGGYVASSESVRNTILINADETPEKAALGLLENLMVKIAYDF